ncbi:zinc finger, CCHC-type containing protein [Tanacetum coccineum]
MDVAAMKHTASNFAKLDKFKGVDYRRWQKKMHFLLSSMSVVYVLTTPIPEDGGDVATVEQIRKRAKWDSDDYVCRGLTLNGMSDSLFDIYHNVESSKELWDSLEAKYMAEDASSKKFLVSNFTNYKMTDSRPVMEHNNELLGILGRDFKHTMKHLKEELTLVELGSHLRIKESLRMQDNNKPKGNNVVGPSVVNMDDDVAWWVDSGETVHVCKDRCWFKTYESLNDGSILYIRNESTAQVHGRGCVDLRLSHVHFKRMQDMSKDGLIPSFDMDTEKCKTCMLTKITKKTFQNVKCETKVLELIHSDQCDLHTTPSLGNKKYFVTFIDDASRAVVRLPDPKLKTLGERGIECISVGHVEHSKAFRFSSVPRPSLMIPNGSKDIGGSVVPEEVTKEDDPKTFDEAMKSQDVTFWKEAINDEIDSIMGNNTWVLADLPLGCKWIFKRKLKVDGTIEKFKASTIRLLIAIASIHNLIIHQIDVKTNFLNGELDEGVYMNQPQGFIMPDNENKVCKLIKSLYGLKQTPKQWHQKFDEVVLSNAYLLNQADKCVYRKFDESGKGVIICLYVDNTLIFGTNQVQVDLTKEFLSSRFSYEGYGEADVILGIRIKHESNGIAISQSHYIEKVLKKFNYFDYTLVSTPMDTSEKLMPNIGQAVSQLEYSRVIGCLMYVMTCTRPDIAFVVGKLSMYTSNPGTQHWQEIQWGLNTTEENSSTSGWVFLLYSGAISWASKKQTCISGSTIESEFVALAAAGKEAEFVATLAKAYSQMYNRKSRHLGIRHSIIRELITNRVVSIEFVRFQQNLADHLTKGLAIDLVIKSAEGMELKLTKRHAFWSLNEDILKTTVLTSNTPIHQGRYGVSVYALTKDHEGNKIQYAVSRRRQYAVFKLYGNKIFWKISNVVLTSRNTL